MRELYATTMQLVDLAGGDPFEVARDRALRWAWRLESPLPDLSERPQGQEPASPEGDDTVVGWWTAGGETARAVEFRLRHPDSDDPTLQWQTTIVLSKIEGRTRVTLRLHRGASVHVLRPGRMSLRAPSLVTDLMRPPLVAYAGTLELVPGTKILTAREVASFVGDVLKAERRALPVLIASSDVSPAFTDTLGRALAGLVQVVRAADASADAALRDALQPQTVPRGGLRLFWPGFGVPDQSLRNPYWTRVHVLAGARGGRSVLGQLVRLLAQVSADRVPPDPGMMVARRQGLVLAMQERREREEANQERARRRRREVQQAARAAREAVDPEEVVRLRERLEDLEDLLQLAEGERDEAAERAEQAATNELRIIEESDELIARATLLGARVAHLEAENDNLRQNIRAIHRFEEAEEADAGDAGEPVPETVGSWEEVAAHLEDLAGPGFHLTQRAIECADGKNRYPHPGVMWEALRSLERVGRAYNEMAAEINMRFDAFALEVGGLDIALQDSAYDACWFEYDGRWYERLPHVKIDDAKSPNQVGRIYFALDSEGQRLIVDWFGTKPDRPATRRPG